MAKNKNSAALFEVMNKGKGLKGDIKRTGMSAFSAWFNRGAKKEEGSAAGLGGAAAGKSVAVPNATGSGEGQKATGRQGLMGVGTPRGTVPQADFGAKGGGVSTPIPVAQVARPAAVASVSAAPASPISVAPAGVAPVGVAPVTAPPAAAAPRPAAVVAAPRAVIAGSTVPVRAPGSHTPRPLTSSLDSPHPEDGPAVTVDSDKGEVSVRLSFVSVGIIVVTILIVVVVAVVVGRRMGEHNAAGLQTTEQLRAGAANPDVLRAQPGQSGGNGLIVEDTGSTNVPPSGSKTLINGNDAPVLPGTSVPNAVPGKVSRVVGLNYVVCQSYDASEENDAKAVVQVLASKGIGATIERRLSGFGSRLVVVSADGYPPKSPEFDSLRRKIDQASVEQARVDKKWRALTPMGYRWK